MLAPLVLLLAMAVIGSVDGAYYHTYKFALYRQPSARLETVTHIIRALMLAVAVWLLAHYTPKGGWFWVLAVVFAIDLIDDVVDVCVEPRSRAPLGGLPTPEYVVHILAMACSGGAWATFLVLGWSARDEPTALVPFGATLPEWLLWFARLVAVAALFTGLSDAVRLTRSVRRDGWRPRTGDAL